jgi:transcription elongation factor Elf1
MSLAGLIASTPKSHITLPISGKKVEYRPFIVKEEKILLMAAESKDEKTINSAIREVISACTNGTVDVFKLPLTDMEYLFLQLRSQSVGETAKPSIKCSKCELPTEVEINLKEIQPTNDPNHKKIIPIVGDISVVMRYPTVDDLKEIEDQPDIEKAFIILIKSIDKVYQGEKIFNASEMDPNEVRSFIEEMTQEQFKKLFAFIETMPKLEKKVNFKCKHCNHENDIVLIGITRFFS